MQPNYYLTTKFCWWLSWVSAAPCFSFKFPLPRPLARPLAHPLARPHPRLPPPISGPPSTTLPSTSHSSPCLSSSLLHLFLLTFHSFIHREIRIVQGEHIVSNLIQFESETVQFNLWCESQLIGRTFKLLIYLIYITSMIIFNVSMRDLRVLSYLNSHTFHANCVEDDNLI